MTAGISAVQYLYMPFLDSMWRFEISLDSLPLSFHNPSDGTPGLKFEISWYGNFTARSWAQGPFETYVHMRIYMQM